MKDWKYRDKIVKSDSRKWEIIRFAITGGIATLIQYICYLILIQWLGMSAVFATVISYLISLFFNFLLSNYFTFHTKPNTKKIGSFLASHMVNMALQTLLVIIFTPLIGKDYALIPAILICIPINYLLVRFSLTSRYFEKNT